jgi:hypothetical protein
MCACFAAAMSVPAPDDATASDPSKMYKSGWTQSPIAAPTAAPAAMIAIMTSVRSSHFGRAGDP